MKIETNSQKRNRKPYQFSIRKLIALSYSNAHHTIATANILPITFRKKKKFPTDLDHTSNCHKMFWDVIYLNSFSLKALTPTARICCCSIIFGVICLKNCRLSSLTEDFFSFLATISFQFDVSFINWWHLRVVYCVALSSIHLTFGLNSSFCQINLNFR